MAERAALRQGDRLTHPAASSGAPATQPRPRVVIVGGGFAGLYAARRLAREPVDVILLDRSNHHLFQPLLYQVATAGLSAIDIAQPIRRILRRQKNATVLLAEVIGIDPEGRSVQLATGRSIAYDYLIVATGATHSYFGNSQWEQRAPGLKTLDDALEIRRRVLLAFERAESAEDPDRRRAALTFIVVGGGPTGAELAGALAELSKLTLVRDFRNFDPSEARILLIEGAERILSPYAEELSVKARRQLESLGVEVLTSTLVESIDERGIRAGDRRIDADTVLWAAGVQASGLGASLGAPLDRAGRVRVESDLSVPGHPEVFVAGDLAAAEDERRRNGGSAEPGTREFGTRESGIGESGIGESGIGESGTRESGATVRGATVPGVAPAAIQGGRHAARQIARRLAGEPTEPFRYIDRGSMATLGRRAAVAEIGRLKLAGLLAWLAWLFVHILFLIGFRNRFVVLFEWSLRYFTYQRNARVILHGAAPPGSDGSATVSAHPGAEDTGAENPGAEDPGAEDAGAENTDAGDPDR